MATSETQTEFRNNMKKILGLLIIVFVSFSQLNAQQAVSLKADAKWTQITTEDISLTFPPAFIVDAEKRDKGQIYEIIGFQNGVLMRLVVFKDNDAKKRLKNFQARFDENIYEFNKDNLNGKIWLSKAESKDFFERIYLASDKNYYIITVNALNKDINEVNKFVLSINLNGKPLLTSTQEKNTVEQSISISTLQTSPDILEALNRKLDKTQINVMFKRWAEQPDKTDYTDYSRPVIILEKPRPTYRPSHNPQATGFFNFPTKLKITFLANGQIGDIVGYSDKDTAYVSSCVEAARKIKFIPAQINGKNVDSTDVVDYSMEMTYEPVQRVKVF